MRYVSMCSGIEAATVAWEPPCQKKVVNMGRKLKYDHTGERFGRLTAIKHVGYGKWLCRCECGSETVVGGSDLRSGKVISCSCARNERVKRLKLSHGMSKTRIYRVWQDMRNRCYYKKSEKYKDYGGRGVEVCAEWRDNFLAFYEWAKETGYDDGAAYGQCTLDRIDVNGNYEPSNCRWVDMGAQARNKRAYKHVAHNKRPVELLDADGNVTKRYQSIREAAEETGCARTSIISACAGRYKTAGGMRWRYA